MCVIFSAFFKVLDRGAPAMDGRIFHLKKHISQNLSYHWTVAEFAKIANLSPPHLYKLFKANLGKSPMRYLQDLRLEKACEL